MGPLDGIRVIEMAGMGPGPFAAMLLADLGADVIRVDRWSDSGDLPDTERRVRGTDPTRYVLHRGRRSLGVDLKAPGATELLLDMAAQADALIEGFRPGVMERLGLGPDACLARNPRLIYGRMTGWGRTARWRRPPGTTSTTSPSRGPSTKWPGRASDRCRR